jgi:glycogen debranching enzyme
MTDTMTDASTDLLSRRREEAIAILRANDRGGYTVPTAGLYPFQWNWDSAFCAMGFLTFDEPRAFEELETLFEGQWRDGLVPHIVFHQPSDTYFPGPEVWGTRHTPPTSGITQPPVAAIAARHLFAKARDRMLAERRTRALYPKLLASHRWWAKARDPDKAGLVAILHNWESGMDNSPAWDAALERVPRTRNPYQRKDLGHVDAAMRPRAIDYDRYVHLVETYRAAGWKPEAMWKAAPFRIQHIGVNAILLKAEEDLLVLAHLFGQPEERDEIAARIERMREAVRRQWNPSLSAFVSRDSLTGADIVTPTSAGFLPLLTDAPDAGQVKAMAAEIRRWRQLSAFGLPTVPADHPTFDGKRYWRGPIWAIMNWLLVMGLTRHGETALAHEIAADTRALLLKHGFAEYFDPVDGSPCGGTSFSWTAAAGLVYALA